MNRNIFGVIIFLLVSVFGCVEKPKPNWYKGNLHTHSYWSDGDEFPEMIMDWYKSNDYQFIALSDHNILANIEKWKLISDKPMYQEAFQKYMVKFNQDASVVIKRDSGRLFVKLKTFNEYTPLFEEKGRFLILPSLEISDKANGKPIHLNAINIEEIIPPQGGDNISDVLQNNIDAVISQSKETGVPMIAHINHPNYKDAISLSDLLPLKNNHFFEVFNGHPHVQNKGNDNQMGTEELWDFVNISYLNNNESLLYGIATDDSHNYHEIDSKWSNAGRGWIQVKADSLSPTSLINAMENGQFYASTGVKLTNVDFRNNKLEIAIEKEAGVNYKVEFIGCYEGDSETKVLKESTGTQASFSLGKNVLFIRARITSDKSPQRPLEEMEFEQAWTQPIQFSK